jgi:WhiB family redox-sensing transcriptional regulator
MRRTSLNSVPTPHDIWKKGLCHAHPEPDIFYPDRDATTYGSVAARAKAICRGTNPDAEPCPVLLECLFYGLITEDPFGIWGGQSARERNALRRMRSLDKYKEASHLRGTRYWALIENYLEQHGEEDEGDESALEGVLGGEEARDSAVGVS